MFLSPQNVPKTLIVIAALTLKKYPLYSVVVSTSAKYSPIFFLSILPFYHFSLSFAKLNFRD
jgi:hypothetical protein